MKKSGEDLLRPLDLRKRRPKTLGAEIPTEIIGLTLETVQKYGTTLSYAPQKENPQVFILIFDIFLDKIHVM